VAEGLELAQPSGKDRRNAVERQFGVNAEKALRLTGGEVLVGVGAQAELEFRQRCGGKSKADSESVATEAGEEIGAGFDGGEERKAVDRAAGAVGDAFFEADDDGGFGSALDDARSKNTDDAAVPTVAVNDEEAVGGDLGVGREAGFNDGERGGLDIAALAIKALEFGSELSSAVGVARGEKFDDVGGNVHAASCVDARGETKGDVEAGDLLACRIERGSGEERPQTGANGAAQLTQAESGDGAILAVERHGIGDGSNRRHLEEAGQGLFAGASGITALQQRLRELERNGRAAKRFLGIRTAGLVGIENRERGGKFVVSVWKMVIRNDEVETEPARGFSFGEGAHAGVNGDHNANPIGVGRFEHPRLHAVAVAQAVRHVETDFAAQYFDGGFE